MDFVSRHRARTKARASSATYATRRPRPPAARDGIGTVVTVLLALSSGVAWGAADATPRVVSLSPVATEVIVALDASEVLVAVDARSAGRVGPTRFPIVDVERAVALGPDLVVMPPAGEDDAPFVDALRAGGTSILEFDPHDFSEAYALCHELGRRLGREASAHRFVLDRSRALAVLSRESLGRRRPRIAVVLGVAPVRIAGGHSYLTDLIEIAGAESVTHGSEDLVVPVSREQLVALAPEGIVVASEDPVRAGDRDAFLEPLPTSIPVSFVRVDPETVWLHEPEAVARAIRDLVVTIVGEGGVSRGAAGDAASVVATTGAAGIGATD